MENSAKISYHKVVYMKYLICKMMLFPKNFICYWASEGKEPPAQPHNLLAHG